MEKEEILADGEHREYYNDNSLKCVYQVKNGKKTGPYVEYCTNSSNIKIEANYKDGVLDGEKKEYNIYGKLTEKQNYKNGLLHGEQMSFGYYSETSTLYDNGEIKREKVSYNIDGKTELRTDMQYRDGEEWSGFRKISESYAHGDVENKKEEIKDKPVAENKIENRTENKMENRHTYNQNRNTYSNNNKEYRQNNYRNNNNQNNNFENRNTRGITGSNNFLE